MSFPCVLSEALLEDTRGHQVPVGRDPVLIGRSNQCAYHIGDTHVSRKQAVVFIDDDGCVKVRNLGGIILAVNEVSLSQGEEATLCPGDKIMVPGVDNYVCLKEQAPSGSVKRGQENRATSPMGKVIQHTEIKKSLAGQQKKRQTREHTGKRPAVPPPPPPLPPAFAGAKYRTKDSQAQLQGTSLKYKSSDGTDFMSQLKHAVCAPRAVLRRIQDIAPRGSPAKTLMIPSQRDLQQLKASLRSTAAPQMQNGDLSGPIVHGSSYGVEVVAPLVGSPRSGDWPSTASFCRANKLGDGICETSGSTEIGSHLDGKGQVGKTHMLPMADTGRVFQPTGEAVEVAATGQVHFAKLATCDQNGCNNAAHEQTAADKQNHSPAERSAEHSKGLYFDDKAAAQVGTTPAGAQYWNGADSHSPHQLISQRNRQDDLPEQVPKSSSLPRVPEQFGIGSASVPSCLPSSNDSSRRHNSQRSPHTVGQSASVDLVGVLVKEEAPPLPPSSPKLVTVTKVQAMECRIAELQRMLVASRKLTFSLKRESMILQRRAAANIQLEHENAQLKLELESLTAVLNQVHQINLVNAEACKSSKVGAADNKSVVAHSKCTSSVVSASQAKESCPMMATSYVETPLPASEGSEATLTPIGSDPVRPFADPFKLVGLPVWRSWTAGIWAAAQVTSWNPERQVHIVTYNAGSELAFCEELDLQCPDVLLSWRDPTVLVPRESVADASTATMVSGRGSTYQGGNLFTGLHSQVPFTPAVMSTPMRWPTSDADNSIVGTATEQRVSYTGLLPLFKASFWTGMEDVQADEIAPSIDAANSKTAHNVLLQTPQCFTEAPFTENLANLLRQDTGLAHSGMAPPEGHLLSYLMASAERISGSDTYSKRSTTPSLSFPQLAGNIDSPSFACGPASPCGKGGGNADEGQAVEPSSGLSKCSVSSPLSITGVTLVTQPISVTCTAISSSQNCEDGQTIVKSDVQHGTTMPSEQAQAADSSVIASDLTPQTQDAILLLALPSLCSNVQPDGITDHPFAFSSLPVQTCYNASLLKGSQSLTSEAAPQHVGQAGPEPLAAPDAVMACDEFPEASSLNTFPAAKIDPVPSHVGTTQDLHELGTTKDTMALAGTGNVLLSQAMHSPMLTQLQHLVAVKLEARNHRVAVSLCVPADHSADNANWPAHESFRSPAGSSWTGGAKATAPICMNLPNRCLADTGPGSVASQLDSVSVPGAVASSGGTAQADEFVLAAEVNDPLPRRSQGQGGAAAEVAVPEGTTCQTGITPVSGPGSDEESSRDSGMDTAVTATEGVSRTVDAKNAPAANAATEAGKQTRHAKRVQVSQSTAKVCRVTRRATKQSALIEASSEPGSVSSVEDTAQNESFLQPRVVRGRAKCAETSREAPKHALRERSISSGRMSPGCCMQHDPQAQATEGCPSTPSLRTRTRALEASKQCGSDNLQTPATGSSGRRAGSRVQRESFAKSASALSPRRTRSGSDATSDKNESSASSAGRLTGRGSEHSPGNSVDSRKGKRARASTSGRRSSKRSQPLDVASVDAALTDIATSVFKPTLTPVAEADELAALSDVADGRPAQASERRTRRRRGKN